jgi:hypothetical protein
MRKKAFNIFFSFLYPVADFLAINFAILLSYKVYRILGHWAVRLLRENSHYPDEFDGESCCGDCSVHLWSL